MASRLAGGPGEMLTVGKVVPMAEAAALVRDGDHVALCGFSIARNAIAFAHQLIRRRARGLTISACIFGMEADLLVGAGCAARILYGGGSIDRFGQLGRLNEACEKGAIEVEYASSLAVTLRYLAGALGLPFMPIQSLLGSALLPPLVAAGVAREIEDPLTGQRVVLLRALHPDVAVLHAQMADGDGNARVLGPRWDNDEAVAAAKRVIVVAEEIVASEALRAQPELTLVPSFRVAAVVWQPFGAHPTGVYRCYDYDADHLALYAERARTQAGFDAYLAEYVLDPPDHEAYLRRVGGAAKLAALRADSERGY